MLGCIKFVSQICSFFFVYIYWIEFIDESTQLDNWFMLAEENLQAGVAIRVETGFFRVFPYENAALVPFEAAVRRLNPLVAVKIRNAAVQAAVRKMYVMSFFAGMGFNVHVGARMTILCIWILIPVSRL